MNPTDSTNTRELDHRFSDGIDVRLLWRPQDDRTLVAVADSKTGEEFTLLVAPSWHPLDVFNHPFAYAGERHAKRTVVKPAARYELDRGRTSPTS